MVLLVMITIFEIEWTFWAGIYKQNFELKNYVLEFSRWNPMGKYFWCNAAAVILLKQKAIHSFNKEETVFV